MPGSPLSLDSLSSPSPSPSPPPGTKQSTKSIASHKDPTARPALDSDSELSELTDDDQDGAASADKRERPPTAPPIASSKSTSSAVPTPPPPPAASSSSGNADEHAGTGNATRGSTSKRGNGLHNRTTSTSRRGGGPRKKRSSLVPAPMWGWAEAKATTSSAPLEEEEEEMAGPPRAMEEEEEEPDEPEEEEEADDDISAGIDEEEDEDNGFVNQRRMGPYVNQRLPGIRSIYSARNGRRQVPAPSRKFDPDNPEPRINGDEHENGSASGSEYNSPKKKKPIKSRPPPSTGSRKRKGSAPRESSGSEHPPPLNKKTKKVQRLDEEERAASDDSKSGDEQTKVNEPEPTPQIIVSPSKFLPSSKPLSSIAMSSNNPAASALAALAVIADSVENATDPALELTNSLLTARKSPTPPPDNNVSSGLEATPAVSPSPENSERDEEPTEPPPTYRNKRPTRRAPQRSKKASDDWRRLAKPPSRVSAAQKPSLDVKIDSSMEDTPDEPVVEAPNDDTEGMDVDPDVDEVDDPEKTIEEEVEEEEPEEETSLQNDEVPPIEDNGEGEGEDDPAPSEGEGDGDEDQEQDIETVENDNEVENEIDEEENENEEQPSPEGDVEDQDIELQPAHRAEALDVLASIELKFAMLRERVYVEKMEILSWEESMIQASVHPEMQYLQKELTKRRDKRLELASRKRSYEVSNATKRRRADEEGVWSWWKLTVDDLQTDMIAETNRKRRKLERDRRALERPQPIRRIPLPPADLPFFPQPSLRTLLKSHPFVHKPVKRRRHRHSRTHQPKNFVYPEISTLSVMDINHDLEFLYQNRRIPSTYDMPFGGPPPLWGQGSSFTHRNGLGGGLPLGRPVGMGLGPTNGGLPTAIQNQAAMGLPQPNSMIQQHPLAFEQFPEASSSYGNTRIRDVYTHGPVGPPPPATSRDPYFGFSPRNPPSPSHGPSTLMGTSGMGYPADHEMGPIPHPLNPNHPHFGQGSAGPPSNFRPSSSHGGIMKGVSNGRRSPSPPPPHMANGMHGSKSNGSWINAGMGMGSFQVGSSSSNGKGEARAMHDDDERDRLAMRDRDRKRVEREKEMDRREYWENLDPERDRLAYMHSSSSVQYSGAPTPGPSLEGHHHHRPHHHHHHHVLHRHGPPLPPPSPVQSGSGGAPPIVHSPRSARDYDIPPSSSTSHPPSDVVMHSSSSSKPLPPPRERDREREREPHWSQRHTMDSPSMHDYRERDQEVRKPYSHRPPSRPVPVDERDRPTSTQFVMTPSSVSSIPPPSSSHMNGVATSTSSSKGQTIWNEDPSYRMPPGGYMGGLPSHEAHHSPVQAHRYTPGGARGLPPANSIHRMVSPPPSSSTSTSHNRARPPPSPFSHSSSLLHRSPPTSPRPRSSSLTKPLPMGSVTPRPTSSSSHTHTPMDSNHLKNGTSTTYSGGRTESPRMSGMHIPSGSGSGGGGRQGMNGNGDLERHAMSPRLVPPPPPPVVHASKLSATSSGR